MSQEEIQRQFRVTGRVQGVGFRWWTRQQAGALGLRGTVRNCPDGSVEIRAAGPASAVEILRARLADGPAAAVVRSVEDEEPPDDGAPDGFRIIR